MKKLFLIPLLTLFSCVMAFADYVAKIGNEEYETLQAALDAAQDGDEIQLGDDIDVMLTLNINKACSLDLNGKTLSSGVSLTASANITISNGNIKGLDVTGTGVVSLSTVTLQEYDMVYYDIVVYTMPPLNISGGVSVIMDECTINGDVKVYASLTMNSGTINNGYVKVGDGNSESSFTMNDGTINGVISKKYAIEGDYGKFTMNGGTINMNGNANDEDIAAVYAFGNSTFTMNGGTINATIIENTNNRIIMGVQVQYGSRFTMEDGEINVAGNSEEFFYGVYVGGTVNNSFLTVNGGSITAGGSLGCAVSVWKGAELNVAGGTLTGSTYGIAGNGNADNSGTIIKITGGTIGSEETPTAIYHPQNGMLRIKGNPVITGQTAIQMCAGTGMTASITGGRFEATGADQSEGKSGDGAINDGAALSMVAREGYAGDPNFTVSGGTFLSKQSTAIKAYKWANNTMSEWEDRANYLSITDGLFSHDPSEYVPKGKKEDGVTPMYIVSEIASPYTDYNKLYQVSLNVAENEMANNFTAAPAEYVKIGSSTTETADTNLDSGTNTVTLEGDQNAKYIKVEENYNLVVDENVTLNIGTGGLMLDENATLTIKPSAVVTVGTNGIINSNEANNLILEANAEEQAVLLIDPDVVQNTKPQATVVLSTKARQKSANPWNYIWEYFASPVVEITEARKPTNNGASVQLYEGNEFITGVYTWGGNDWSLVNHWTDLVPFKGYQLTNNSANGGVEYTFKGNLLGNEDGEYAFTSNGYGYFGNSYSAPIVISNFLSALDNTVYERTVWLYDAGADTYVSVNPLAARLGSAKYKDGTAIKEIRSLQAFILNKKEDGAAATINYRDAIWNNPRINSLVSAAPAREQANDMQWTNIYVEANGNKELVTLVEGADFSNEFDNGADAGKYINNNSMNLYAATSDGEQAIVATDNLENTLLSFQAGNATEYTLTFENSNENYMLRDNVTGLTIAMIEGAEYSFTQAANSTAQARFEVIAIAKMPTALENVEEAAKATGIYTITGQYMGRDFTKLPAGVYVVNGVKIVK